MLWKGGSDIHPARLLPIVPLPGATVAPAADSGRAVASAAAADAVATVPGMPAGVKMAERDQVIAAMEKSGWVQAKAARILGLTPRQIGYALKKYGIEVKHF